MLADLFNSGQRPAVDSGQSVSRVGGKAQLKAMRQVAGSLKIELANYRELQSFAQFGSDLDPATQKVLRHGEILMEVLKQPQYTPYPVGRQIYELFVAKNRYLNDVPLKEIHAKLTDGYNNLLVKNPLLIDNIVKEKVISEENERLLIEHCDAFYKK